MKKNYYYLIAGLPELSMDDHKLSLSVQEFRETYYPELSAEDRRLLDLIYLEVDNTNFLRLMADKDAVLEENGLYTADELREIIEAARMGEKPDKKYPRYFYDYVAATSDEEQAGEAAFAEDRLALGYYNYAMQCGNSFVARWFAFNLNLNNFLTALTARRYKLDLKSLIVGDNDIAEALRTSNSRDFGLTGILDDMEELMRISEMDNLIEREHRIDMIKWNWMDEGSFFNYFTVEKLFAFLVKMQIIERWIKLDPVAGGEHLRGMIRNLKEEVEVPAEFTVNKNK